MYKVFQQLNTEKVVPTQFPNSFDDVQGIPAIK
jgi:hypothetical protein